MRKKDVLKGLRFCITGKTPGTKSQSEMADVISSYGGTTTQSVSPNTDYLIDGMQIAKNIKGKLSRNEKRALELETIVLTYEDLLKEIKNDNGKRLRELAKQK